MSRKKPLIEEMWIGNKPVPAIMEERTLDSLGIKTKYDSVKGAKPLSAKLLTCIPVILRKIEDEEAEKKDGKAKQGSKEEKAEQEEKKNKLVLNREFVRSAVRKTQLKPNDKVKVWVIENEQLDVMDNMAIHMLFREIEPAEFYGETEDLMSSIYGDAEKAKVFSEYFLARWPTSRVECNFFRNWIDRCLAILGLAECHAQSVQAGCIPHQSVTDALIHARLCPC